MSGPDVSSMPRTWAQPVLQASAAKTSLIEIIVTPSGSGHREDAAVEITDTERKITFGQIARCDARESTGDAMRPDRVGLARRERARRDLDLGGRSERYISELAVE